MCEHNEKLFSSYLALLDDDAYHPPIVGSEQQAEDLISYMKENARKKEDGIWDTNIFGKSIEQIVEDGIQAKVSHLTKDPNLLSFIFRI